MTMLSTGMELTGTLRKASTGVVLFALIGANFSALAVPQHPCLQEQVVCRRACLQMDLRQRTSCSEACETAAHACWQPYRDQRLSNGNTGQRVPGTATPGHPDTNVSYCTKRMQDERSVAKGAASDGPTEAELCQAVETAGNRAYELAFKKQGEVWRTVLPGELGRSLGAMADGSRALAGNTTFRISSFKKRACQPAKPKGSFHCSYEMSLLHQSRGGALVPSFTMPMAGTASAHLVRSGNTWEAEIDPPHRGQSSRGINEEMEQRLADDFKRHENASADHAERRAREEERREEERRRQQDERDRIEVRRSRCPGQSEFQYCDGN
jgi:hypothetical protein